MIKYDRNNGQQVVVITRVKVSPGLISQKVFFKKSLAICSLVN